MADEFNGKRRRVSPRAESLLREAQAALAFADKALQGSEDPEQLVQDVCEELKASAWELVDAALDGVEAPPCLALLRTRLREVEERLSFLEEARTPIAASRIAEVEKYVREIISLLATHAILHLEDPEKIEEAQAVAVGLERLRCDLINGLPVSAVAISGGVHFAVEIIAAG